MGDYVHGPDANHKVEHPNISEKDIERGHTTPVYSDTETGSQEIIHARELQEKTSFLRKLRDGEDWLDAKMGIETQGVDRIHEADKKPPSILNVFLLWWSMTCHVGTAAIGILGPEFGLTFNQSMAAVVVGTVLGAMCTGYCGTLGPKTGLRAIATSRYSFGFWGAKLCSVLNVVIGGGFGVVNVVVVGQMLSAVSDYKMTLVVGIIIIAVLGYVISIFGFAMIHTYEKYSWIATFILLIVLTAQVGPKCDVGIPTELSGLGLAGTWLSFMSICFSSASGWCSMASDYYCNYPADTRPSKIFFLTFFGISIPTIFATAVGVILGQVAISSSFLPSNPNAALSEVYEAHGLGGLILESYHPTGFGKFALVILVFSVLGNNIAVNYSSGLSIQLLGHYFHAIPRFVWSFLNALVIAVLAIAGREHLSTIVSNFVSLLGYWTVSFTFILLIEDQWFRKHSKTIHGYDLAVWDIPNKLPFGAAAVISLLAGYLAGGVTGMSQVWYIGPIALKFGPYGGDVGIFLSGAFTIVTYFPLRYFEIKKFGR